ncbi:hypothetical protein Bbelb_157240 [Branchiostoma belcheri]|nr:hypothetical protein Bbelb_157240 [Branchiostoma belcheri]
MSDSFFEILYKNAGNAISEGSAEAGGKDLLQPRGIPVPTTIRLDTRLIVTLSTRTPAGVNRNAAHDLNHARWIRSQSVQIYNPAAPTYWYGVLILQPLLAYSQPPANQSPTMAQPPVQSRMF